MSRALGLRPHGIWHYETVLLLIVQDLATNNMQGFMSVYALSFMYLT